MAYTKSVYKNGAIAYPDWTQQTKRYFPWQYQVIKYPDWRDQTVIPTLNVPTSDFYSGTKYNTIRNKQKETESLYANYNDSKQINSLRDIVFGTFNQDMKHSKIFGEDFSKIPVLNILSDTLDYHYKYILKPIFKGDPKAALLNTLTNLGETSDFYMNPLKATIKGIAHGKTADEIARDVRSSLIGDEQGIKNFDYDTGNTLLDIALEIGTDPGTWLTFGGKGAVNAVGKSATKLDTLKDAVKVILKKAGKNVDNLSDDVLELAAKEIVNKIPKAVYNNPDYATQLFKKNITKELSEKVAKTALNGSPFATRTALYKASGHIADALGDNAADIYKILNKGIQDTVTDMTTAALTKIAASTAGSLGLKAVRLDDLVSKWTLKAALVPAGITPLYELALKPQSPLKTILDNRMVKKVIEATHPENVLQTHKGVMQVIGKEQSINQIFTNVSKTSIHEALKYVSGAIMSYADQISDILKNSELDEVAKRKAILGIISTIDSDMKFKSVHQFLKYLEDLNEIALKSLGEGVTETGLEGFIKRFKNYDKIYKNLGKIIKYKEEMKAIRDPRVLSNFFVKLISDIDSKNLNIKDVMLIIGLKEDLINYANNPLFKDIVKSLQGLFKAILDNESKYQASWTKATKGMRYLDLTKIQGLSIKAHSWYGIALEGIINDLDILEKKLPKQILNGVDEIKEFKKTLKNTKKLLQNPNLMDLVETIDELGMGAGKQVKAIKAGKFTKSTGLEDSFEELIQKHPEVVDYIYNELDKVNKEYTAHIMKHAQDFNKETKLAVKTKPYTIRDTLVYKNQVIENSKYEKKYLKLANEILNTSKQIILQNDFAFTNYDMTTSNLIAEALKKARIAFEESYNMKTFDEKAFRRFEKAFSDNDFMQTLRETRDDALAKGFIADVQVEPFDNLIIDLEEYITSLSIYSELKHKKGPKKKILRSTLDRIYNAQQNAMQDLQQVQSLINKKTALRNELKGVGHDFDALSGYGSYSGVRMEFFVDAQHPKDITIAVGDKNITLNLKDKVEILQGIYRDKASGAMYTFNTDIIGIEKVQKEFYKQTNRYLTDEELKDLFQISKAKGNLPLSAEGDKLIRRNEVINSLEELLTIVNVQELEQEFIEGVLSEKLFSMQIEHSAQNALIENIEAIQSLRKSKTFNIYKQQLLNDLNITVQSCFNMCNLTEDDKVAIALISQYLDGLDNKYWLNSQINRLFAGAGEKETKIKAAIVTTLANFSNINIDSPEATLDNIMEKLLRDVGMNYNTTDLSFQKVDVDTLLRKVGIDPENPTEIYKIMEESGVPESELGKRHGALFDCFAQHIAYEKNSGDVPYFGYTLDIETTGLVDKNGLPNGDILEISVIKRNEDGKLEVVFNNHIKVTEDQVRINENTHPLVLKKMNMTQEEYLEKYTDKKIATDVGFDLNHTTEDMLVSEFIEFLRTIPAGSSVMTHNGTEHDWVFLRNKIRKSINNSPLVAKDKESLVNSRTLRNQIQHRLKNFDEIIADLDILDSRIILSKNVDPVTEMQLYQFRNIIEQYLEMQQDLKKYHRFTNSPESLINAPVKVITNIDDTFKVGLEELIQLDDIQTIRYRNEIDFEDSIDLVRGQDVSELYDYEEHYGTKLKGKAPIDAEHIDNALEDVGYIDTSNAPVLSTEIRAMLRNLREDMLATFDDIKKMNKHFKSYLIPSDIFDKTIQDPRMLKIRKRLRKDLVDIFKVDNPKLAAKIKTADFTNLSQIMALVKEGAPFFSYKNIDMGVLDVFDWSWANHSATKYTITKADDFLRTVNQTYDMIYNTTLLGTYEKDIEGAFAIIKKNPISFAGKLLKYDPSNPKFSLAQLEAYYHGLHSRLSEHTEDALATSQMIAELKQTYPELMEYIDRGMFKTNLSLNTNYNNYIPSPLRKMQSAEDEFNDLLAAESVIEAPIQKLKKSSEGIHKDPTIIGHQNSSIRAYSKALEDYKDTFVDKTATNTTKSYNRTSRRTTEVLAAKAMYNKLTLSPIDLRNEIVANTSNMSIVFRTPTNQYFKNHDAFVQLLANKKDYEAVGLKFKYDEQTRQLLITLDDDVIVVKNKNKYKHKAAYSIDGEDIIAPELAEITEEEFKRNLTGSDIWIDDLWELRKSSVAINPELSGRLELVNYDEYYKVVNEESAAKFGIDWEKAHINYLDPQHNPYFFSDMVGTPEEMMEMAGSFNVSYFEMAGHNLNKVWNHTNKYQEYVSWLQTSGFRIDRPEFAKMSNKELREALTNNPEMVLCVLKPNKHSTGGIELARISSYSDSTLDLAKKAGAIILPYDFYTSAAQNINEFTYGSKTVAIWNHFLTYVKKSWIFDAGVIMRNTIDSSMRTLVETGSVSETVKNYTEAFTLLTEYEKISREIRKMSPVGKFTLKNMNDYFDIFIDKLTKEEYMTLYEFLENSGVSTLNNLVDGLFGQGMKLNNWVEKTSRLSTLLAMQKQGKNYSEALARIAKIHFNYDTKSYGDFIMQNFIPFWTYTSSNIEYMVHLIEEHPAFLKNFISAYTPIWDFDSLNQEELENNLSLQYQIINGNIPLSMFGYKDKTITRQVKTKYGMKTQKVVNPAVIKMGSSIIDGLSMFVDPFHALINKTAPPIQTVLDTVKEYAEESAFGNIDGFKYNSYKESEDYYKTHLASQSIQQMLDDPVKFLNNVPHIDKIIQRLTYIDENGNRKLGSPVTKRTDNKLIGMLGTLGMLGATNRWGEFENTPKKFKRSNKHHSFSRYSKRPFYSRMYAKKSYANKFYAATPRPGQGVTYRTLPGGRFQTYYTGYTPRVYTSGKRPWSAYENFVFNSQHPNYAHHNPSRINNTNIQSIPQYLYSYMGKNRYGKSKILGWMHMNTEYKVKNTLKRYARPRIY